MVAKVGLIGFSGADARPVFGGGSRRTSAAPSDPWPSMPPLSRISRRTGAGKHRTPALHAGATAGGIPDHPPASPIWPCSARVSAAGSGRSQSCAPSSTARGPPDRFRATRARSRGLSSDGPAGSAGTSRTPLPSRPSVVPPCSLKNLSFRLGSHQHLPSLLHMAAGHTLQVQLGRPPSTGSRPCTRTAAPAKNGASRTSRGHAPALSASAGSAGPLEYALVCGSLARGTGSGPPVARGDGHGTECCEP